MSIEVSNSKSKPLFSKLNTSSLQFGKSLRHYLSDPNFNLQHYENKNFFLSEQIPVLLKGGYQVDPNLLIQENESLTLKCYFTIIEEKLFGIASKQYKGLIVVHFAKIAFNEGTEKFERIVLMADRADEIQRLKKILLHYNRIKI
ncbi:hypothetical protein HDU92_006593 [Lobulomyces angularis]|nr:hypothetical protein HDU92_006593 [Lobulomyces angularis]